MLIESQRQATSVILTYRYRLLPTKQQHRALEAILESQRQLYKAALEERIDAYRKAHVTRTYFDQSKALTEWRHEESPCRRASFGSRACHERFGSICIGQCPRTRS